MYDGVEPDMVQKADGSQLRDSNFTSFMQLKPAKWTKEGLLEYIVELVVVEDKVRFQCSLLFLSLFCVFCLGLHSRRQGTISANSEVSTSTNLGI